MIVGVLFSEIHMMYAALVGGDAPVELPRPAGTATTASGSARRWMR